MSATNGEPFGSGGPFTSLLLRRPRSGQGIRRLHCRRISGGYWEYVAVLGSGKQLSGAFSPGSGGISGGKGEQASP